MVECCVYAGDKHAGCLVGSVARRVTHADVGYSTGYNDFNFVQKAERSKRVHVAQGWVLVEIGVLRV